MREEIVILTAYLSKKYQVSRKCIEDKKIKSIDSNAGFLISLNFLIVIELQRKNRYSYIRILCFFFTDFDFTFKIALLQNKNEINCLSAYGRVVL